MIGVVQATAQIKKKNTFAKQFNKYKYFYLLLLPGVVYLICFKFIPIASLVIAFKDYNFKAGVWGSEWIGMENFQKLFSSGDFPEVIRNTIVISLYKLIFCFPAPLILAILLNEVRNLKLKKLMQTVVYLPHFLSWVIIAGIITTLCSSTGGILSVLGLERSPLTNPSTFRGLIVVSEMWKETGWGTIVYLAAISSIGMDMYEAAEIDGANRIQRIFHITLPSIRSTIAILLILRTGTILSAGFDQVYNLYSPIVYDVADIIDTYVYRIGIANSKFGLATAAGLFQSVVGFILVVITNFVTKKLGEEGIM